MPGFGPASAPVVDCSTLVHLGVRSSHEIDQMRTPRGVARLLVAQPVDHSDARFSGSPQESDERRILGGFPKNDEFGLGYRHPLYFQQEIAEVAIAPPAAQQGFDVAIHGLDHSHGHFHAAVV